MKLENTILKDLFKSVKGLSMDVFTSRYKFKPEEVEQFISKYENKGIIIFKNHRIYLSKEGREIIVKQRFQPKNTRNKFANIPKEFLAPKLKINEPYLPNIEHVSADILKTKKVV
jgi:hypothetical protein